MEVNSDRLSPSPGWRLETLLSSKCFWSYVGEPARNWPGILHVGKSSMFRIIKLILIITISCFAVAAVSISLTVVERQNALREVSRYNLTWVATQAVNETLRFELRIADLAGNASTKDLAEVRTRLDILYNRLGVLKEGMISAYIERYPDENEVINELDSVLNQIE